MNLTEIGRLLGDASRGAEVLAAIDPSEGRALSQAIRASFKPGDEQGNERRLRAVVTLEGEGALDLLTAVLEDAVEVGGVYSNLRNAALPIMAEHFLAALQLLAKVPGGRPALREIIDAEIGPGAARADIFIEALGPVALEPDVIGMILPLARRLPAAAEAAAASDRGVAAGESTVHRIMLKNRDSL